MTGKGQRKNELSTSEKRERLLRYSQQLAMLNGLLGRKLITQKEYEVIKQKLMQDYHIQSEWMAY